VFWGVNSQFFEKKSLLGPPKFPVPLRRDFCCKTLNSLTDWAPKSLRSALNLQISLLISLLAGIWVWRPVRSGLHRQPLI
jgi:hypothetical protein